MKEQGMILLERYTAALQVFIELLEKETTYMSIEQAEENPTYTEVLNSLKGCLLNSLLESGA